MVGQTQRAAGFLAEVQGLRAIAVMLVVVYHLGFAGLPGGYVGVDVFFVISGFLITRLLLAEHQETGRIDLWRFYARRIRRILPALVVTVVLCLVAGALLLPAQPYEDLAKSALAALLSLSNVFFWSQSGYFDSDAIAKPLLHTWSLGVEEQFYIVWPLILSVALARFGRGPALRVLAVLAAFSFVANLTVGYGWLSGPPDVAGGAEGADQAASVFFLPWFRVFEFAFGAGLCFLRVTPPRWLAEGLCATGLALILLSALVLREGMIFPGLPALLPCLGAALVIACGSGTRAGALLRIPVALFLGRISYSLYLVHWPVVSFFYLVTFRTPTLVEALAGFALMMVLAVVLNLLVEEPIRYRRGAGTKAILGASGVVLAFALAIDQGEGWQWRLTAGSAVLTAKEYREQESRACQEPTVAADLVSCEIRNGDAQVVYVWGDSHARHLAPGLAALMPGATIRILYRSSCMAQSGMLDFDYDYEGRTELAEGCRARNRDALAFLSALPEPAIVLLSSYVRPGVDDSAPFIDATSALLGQLRAAGHQAVLLGDVIRPGFDATVCFAQAPALFQSPVEGRCRIDPASAQDQIRVQDNLLAALGKDGFVRTADIFCDGTECRTWQDDELLFRDDHHLTPNGSIFYVRAILDRLAQIALVNGSGG